MLGSFCIQTVNDETFENCVSSSLETVDGSRSLPHNHTYAHGRASNYRPRNQYRDRFFTDNGTHTTIPGAIPKAQRSYTTPYSSKNQRESSLHSQERQAHLQEQEQAENGYDVDDGDERFDYYGHPSWTMEVREGEQLKKSTSTWRRDMSRRSLVDTDSDTEPAVESPLSCVSEGDSVIFDISSGCYPVYEKDSLLNSNKE